MGIVTLSLSTGSSAFASAAPGLAKSYTGSAHNMTAAESAPITLSGVTENGDAISGTFAFHSPLAGTGPFTGTISSSAVRFEVKPTAASCSSCSDVIFTGNVSPLVSMSGTWVAHLKSGSSQNGTWSVGSTWNGTFRNLTQQLGGDMALADVTESAKGVITGALVVYGYDGSGSFTGSVHGSVIKFTVANPAGDGGVVFTWTGTVSILGGMSGTYSYSGGHGIFQVHRSGATSTAV